MANYDDTNRGALFKNDKKEKDTHPDYRGSINVNGVDHWISAWLKTSRQGTKFMSLSVSPKKQANYAPAPAPRKAPSQDAFKARQLPQQQPQHDNFEDPPF